MISVTRKSHIATLPLGKGRPMWACGSSWTAVVMVQFPSKSSSEPRPLGSGVVSRSLTVAALNSLFPQRVHQSIQHEQGEQCGQIHQRATQDAAGVGDGTVARKADGARQEKQT